MRFGGFQDWRRPIRHTGGAVAVYVALGAAVTFGIVGLAIDATRAMIVHSESQAAADAAALAAASQLDGTPSAITRAENAIINNLVSNDQLLAATGAGAVSVPTRRYLTGLPMVGTSTTYNDAASLDAFVTTDPLRARFVEVTTAPLQHANTFLTAVGVAPTVNITTRAVAGCRQAICRSQPLMICNPAEAGGNSGASFNIDTWRGRQVLFVHQGGANASWVPGNFGYLEAGGSGVPVLINALASTAGGNICYGPGATTEPGAKNGARNALNVRFGIYQTPGFNNADANNPLFAPDRNVRSMPRDLAWTGPQNRFGNGRWNCQTYWNANFAASGVTRPSGCVDNTNAITRHQMYEFEIDNNLVDDPGPGGVTGIPPRGAANAIEGRRIVYVSVVNCVQEDVRGTDNVHPIAYLKVFLTEPVSEPSGVEIVGEIVDIVELGADDAVLRDTVQLYR